MNEQIDNKDAMTFIVGMPRTGSKIFKHIINHNSEINISSEIFFISPAWLRKDVATIIKEEIGGLETDEALNKLVEYVFSNRFFGTYFRDIKSDREKLLELFKAGDNSHKAIFKALLAFDAHRHKKDLLGAKFPIHITRAQILYEWFPEARFIHLNRHPLAIYNSQKKKHLKVENGIFQNRVTLLKIFIATLISYRSSEKFYKQNLGKENYILFNYEQLVTNPEKEIKRLCEFLNIPFKPSMMSPPSEGSSYEQRSNKQEKGIHSRSLDRWKDEVGFLEKLLFKVLTKSEFKQKTAC